MKHRKPQSVRKRNSAEVKEQAQVIGETSWSRRRRSGVRQKKPFQWKVFFGKSWRYTRFSISALALILIVVSPYLVWQYLEVNNVFKIQRVTIHSNEKYLVGERKDKMVNELLGQNFVSYDAVEYRNNLLENPWVKTAEVNRRWPDEIELIIEERRPVAIWNDFQLIESDGSIFEPDLMPSDVMINLLSNVEQKEKILAGMAVIEKEIQSVGLIVEKIILDYRGAWTIVLDNDVELYLGARFFDERLQRFVAHYPSSIRSKIDSVAAIDFRYDHGYALKWKR